MKKLSRKAARAMCAAPALFLAIMLAVVPATAQQPKSMPQTDEEYARLLSENPHESRQIQGVDSLLAEDGELEESFVAYEDSLSAHPELAEHEGALFKALEEDSALAQALAELEVAAAKDPEAAEEIAAEDSIMASDPQFAEKMMELETAAAEDPELLDRYGEQMAYLWSRPAEAEEFFSDEDGPYYPGEDETMVSFVYYLEDHPRLFRAYWDLYHYLGAHEAMKRGVYRHWRWYMPRRHIWIADWRCQLLAAGDARVHRLVWGRRVYLGKRPWLNRAVWRYHLVVASRPLARPVIWKHGAFVARHPKVAGAVAKHRGWVKAHGPRPSKARAPKAKVGSPESPRMEKAKSPPKPKPKKGAR